MKRVLVLLATVCLCLTGCSEFYELDVLQENGDIAFTSEHFAKTPVSIDTVSVWRVDCEADCDFWQAHRPANVIADPVLYGNGKIRYGQKFDQIVETVKAKPLQPGKYQVGAEVIFKNEDNELVGGRFAGEFVLELSDGELVLVAE